MVLTCSTTCVTCYSHKSVLVDSFNNLTEFSECLSELHTIMESNEVETLFIPGDFNAHPGELFSY